MRGCVETSVFAALAAIAAAGCFTIQPPPNPPPTSMQSWGPLGGFSVNYGTGSCSGRVTLTDGLATVNDPCFTSAGNAVVCTDNSALNPVKCTPTINNLLIAGTGSDSISYARVK